jgi:mono/diheme cytochrome c family protein
MLCAAGCLGPNRVSGLARAPESARVRPNPVAADPSSVRAGRKLFARHCAECHGDDGRGSTGPSLLTGRVREASPGQLFWILTNGDLPAGMPAWSHLPEPRRWQIAAYLKALHADPAVTRPERSSTAAARRPSPPRPR